MKLSRTIAALLGAMLFTLGVAAHARPAGVGDSLPAPFTLLSEQEKPQDYAAMRGSKGAVILFVRSLDWCPFCKKQVAAWDAARAPFEQAGYRVMAVSYDAPATLRDARASLALSLPLYSDPHSAMIEALGIRNRDIAKDNVRMYGIPNPTIFVVDAAGRITHRFAEEGYEKRPEIAQVQKALGL